MNTVLATTHPLKATRLVDQVSALRATLDREGVSITDMSRAGSLEMNLGSDDPELDLTHSEGPVDIVRLEGPIAARPVGTAAPGASAFRFFLDGAQKTIPVCRIGLTPVVMAISAAGILERDDSGQPRLVREALRVQQSWIAPTRLDNTALSRLIDEILSSGGLIEDPLEYPDGQPLDDYDHIAGNYGQTLSLSFKLAGELRARQEKHLINQWQSSMIHSGPESWIVVDGPLRGNVPNAVGLVKNLQTQQLTHNEAIALFDLPQGSRTTAFRYASAGADPDHDATEGKTMWYMRLWSPTGMDARHSLVRIEAANDVATTAQIDEISSWILAERLPRATADPRWPTLLYPIHYLERILKRRLSELTAGWPSA
jgi:hypothetical protein